jgi:hypothetical protein
VQLQAHGPGCSSAAGWERGLFRQAKETLPASWRAGCCKQVAPTWGSPGHTTANSATRSGGACACSWSPGPAAAAGSAAAAATISSKPCVPFNRRGRGCVDGWPLVLQSAGACLLLGGGGGGLLCCDWHQRNHVLVSGASGGCRLVAGSADGLLLCCTSCAAACVGRLVAGPHEATSVCKYTTHVEWDAYMAVSTTPGSQACPHRQVGSMRSRQRHSRKSCNGAFCRAMYIVD